MDKSMEQKTQEIIDLMNGSPGPFLEDDSSYFGQKKTDPSMKDAFMETDCGGAIITKSKTTYGEADRIAAEVDLTGFLEFVGKLKNNCYWKQPVQENWRYYGEWYYAVYQYLKSKGYLKQYDEEYSNSTEYLLNEVCNRLVAEKYLDLDTTCKYLTVRSVNNA